MLAVSGGDRAPVSSRLQLRRWRRGLGRASSRLASLGAASGAPRLHLYCSVKRSAAYRRRAASVAAAVPPPSLHPLPRCAAGPSFAGSLPRAVPRQVEASPGLPPGLAYVCVFKTSVQTGLGKAREGCDGAAGASGRISSLVC